ncbi:hypothetical protein KX729_16920 [Rhizobium sp. XQZ8]|uniref:hypothetical protein n=1 Tax=Rhizobium populisoli TaxID=2859785 RepID=UPI001CA5102B|nr:hypothetical protein [Rhizobium populisoli]MBW6423142.1 hypothetical protein [Rhizobium populisoli]
MIYKRNELGFMIEPDFHDGYLTGIRTFDKTVELTMKHLVKGAFQILLLEVEELQADEFKLGNIVMNVRLTSGTRPSPEDLSILHPHPHPAVPKYVHDQHADFRERQISRIAQREVILFQMSASYGCDLSAICKKVEIQTLETH